MHNEICKEQLAPEITFSHSVLFLGTHMETQFFPSRKLEIIDIPYSQVLCYSSRKKFEECREIIITAVVTHSGP